MSVLACFFDEADVAAAFQPRDFDIRDIFSLGGKPQIFFEIMGRDEMPPQRFPIDLAVGNELYLIALDQLSESVRTTGDKREDSMNQHQENRATDGRKKAGAAVDRAGEGSADENKVQRV